MNAIHRVGLTIAGVATAATIAGAFVMQGYVAAQQAAAQPVAQAAPTSNETQIVYVRPAPTAAPTATPAPADTPPIIHVIVPSRGDDGGNDD